jgi:hypothetical protein
MDVGKRYRDNSIRYWDALVEIAVAHGIDRESIPERWSYKAEKDLYTWIGHAVVQAALKPSKRGRPKGSSTRAEIYSPEDPAKNKRKQRDNLWTTGTRRDGKPYISDKEWSRRWELREAKKRRAKPTDPKSRP